MRQVAQALSFSRGGEAEVKSDRHTACTRMQKKLCIHVRLVNERRACVASQTCMASCASVAAQQSVHIVYTCIYIYIHKLHTSKYYIHDAFNYYPMHNKPRCTLCIKYHLMHNKPRYNYHLHCEPDVHGLVCQYRRAAVCIVNIYKI
jgi:hypothetical protein